MGEQTGDESPCSVVSVRQLGVRLPFHVHRQPEGDSQLNSLRHSALTLAPPHPQPRPLSLQPVPPRQQIGQRPLGHGDRA